MGVKKCLFEVLGRKKPPQGETPPVRPNCRTGMPATGPAVRPIQPSASRRAAPSPVRPAPPPSPAEAPPAPTPVVSAPSAPSRPPPPALPSESIGAVGRELGELTRLCERIVSEVNAQKKISQRLTEEIQQLGTRLGEPAPRREDESELGESERRRVQILEGKVRRLAAALDEAETERERFRRLAKRLEETGGGLRTNLAFGVDDDDPDKERKLSALKNLFEENVWLRENMAKRPATASGPMTVGGIKKIAARPAAAAAPPPLTVVRRRAA